MGLRRPSRVRVVVALCLAVLAASCGSRQDEAFRRAVGRVISEAIDLEGKLAFSGTNYNAEKLEAARSGADGIVRTYLEHVTALPQPETKELRYLRMRLLSHGEVARARHEAFAMYLASVDNPSQVHLAVARLELLQASDAAVVQSTRLLGASERVALRTRAVEDWIAAVGSRDWYGTLDGDVNEPDSASAFGSRVRREIEAMR